MRLKVIACKVLTRELGYLSASCPNFLDITWLRQGYHNEPEKLREILQEQIDRIDSGDDAYTCGAGLGDFDAILLGYGLCSNGVCGVRSKKYPIVIPRAHDCITLFLGSKERYRTLFDSADGGVYWYTPGWIENSTMPSKARDDNELACYTEMYGEDNAEYLCEMSRGWLTKYRFAYYIQMPGIAYPDYRSYTRSCADYLNWDFRELEGDNTLLQSMIDGNWDESRFLVVPPGACAEPSYDAGIVKTAPPRKELGYIDD